MAIDDNLKGRMARVANLGSLVNGYEHMGYDEKAKAIALFPRIFAESDEDVMRLEDEIEGYDDETRYKFMKTSLASESRRITPDYEANLDEIVGGIVGKLNADLEGVEDMETPLEAISKVAYAFMPFVENREPTQEEAEGLMRQELSERYGVRFKNVKGANPKQYKSMFLSLQARGRVLQYLKEEKDNEGKVVSYRIDEEKLREEIKDKPEMGSILYLTEKPENGEAAEEAYAQAA